MKITLLCTGKTDFSYINSGVQIYEERLKHYVKFSVLYISALKNVSSLTEEQIKEKEGMLIQSIFHTIKKDTTAPAILQKNVNNGQH